MLLTTVCCVYWFYNQAFPLPVDAFPRMLFRLMHQTVPNFGKVSSFHKELGAARKEMADTVITLSANTTKTTVAVLRSFQSASLVGVVDFASIY